MLPLGLYECYNDGVIKLRSAFNQLLSVFKPNARYYVEFLIGLILVVQGVLQFLPGLQLPQTTFTVIPANIGEFIVSLWQVVSGLALIIGVGLVGRWSHRLRRIGSFGSFFAFSFLTFLGIISEEVNDLYWIVTFGLALMCATLYIHVGWEKKDE
jgi:hypothetical protein